MQPNSPEAYALRAKQELIEEIRDAKETSESRGNTLCKTVLSLSGGALVFSMTFVEKLAPLKQNISILFAAWIAFGASILATLVMMKKAQDTATKNMLQFVQLISELEKFAAECITNNKNVHINRFPMKNGLVVALNWTAVIACLVGIVLLGVFVAINLLAAQ